MTLLIVGIIIVAKGHWILGSIVILETVCDILLQNSVI